MVADQSTELQSCVINTVGIPKGMFTDKINYVKFIVFRLIVYFSLCVFRFAYVEFADKESVQNSIVLSDSLFKGRQIKV